MKKIIALLCTAALLSGCSKPAQQPSSSVEPTATPAQTETAKIKVLSPTGAPALATIGAYVDGIADVTYVDGTDVLQAAFVNPNPEYDVILAPSNLGAKLAEAGKTEYRMEAVITWGNLYLVGTSADALSQPGTLAAFGENAVPQIVFDMAMQDFVPVPEVVYYNSVAEAQAALLSGKATCALLAEPAATATIAKAKEAGTELQIIMDLQSEWQKTTKTEGYPQAAIFVRENQSEDVEKGIEQFLTTTQTFLSQADDNSADELSALVEQVGADQLGVPSAQIVSKTWSGMNLSYKPAAEVKPELQAFLSNFGVNDIDAILAQK